jgi:uncharacterized protein
MSRRAERGKLSIGTAAGTGASGLRKGDRSIQIAGILASPAKQSVANQQESLSVPKLESMTSKFLFSLVTLIFVSVSVGAEISPEKRVEIEKMLRLTGMERLMDQMKGQMITGLKPTAPTLPDAFWERIEKELDMGELIEQILPVYDKYYTLEDLRAVNGFYSSPAGQKILKTLPEVMQESMKIGQEWGEKIGERVGREVVAEQAKKKQKQNSL